jgi:hypothetical protein
MEEEDYCIAVKSPKQKSLSGTTTALGNGNLDVIKWKILADGEHMKKSEDPLTYPDQLAIKKVIDFEAQSFDTIFFNDFFPCILKGMPNFFMSTSLTSEPHST